MQESFKDTFLHRLSASACLLLTTRSDLYSTYVLLLLTGLSNLLSLVLM